MRAIVLAFDSDKRRKPQVLQAEKAMADLLRPLARVLVAEWDESRGKGIDDLLTAGGTPDVLPYDDEDEDCASVGRNPVEVTREYAAWVAP